MRNWSLMTSGLEPEFRRSLSKLEPRCARNVHETAGDIPAQARCSLAVCSEACLEAIFDVWCTNSRKCCSGYEHCMVGKSSVWSVAIAGTV